MIRKTKALGLAFVAVLAVSAVAASAAQAQGTFVYETGTSKLVAAQQAVQKFHVEAGNVECSELKGEATSLPASPATEIQTTFLTYSNQTNTEDKCTGPVGTQPKIEMNGCQYTFHAGETLEGEEKTSGSADIKCGGTNQIVINAPGCTIKVPAQNGLQQVIFQNNGGQQVVINPIVINITYQQGGLFCTNTEKQNGTYQGNSVVQGQQSGGTATKVQVK
jgi:hypothetical protein